MTIRAHSKEFCALLALKSRHINKVVQRVGRGETERGSYSPLRPTLTCCPLTIMNNFKCQRRRFTRNSIICGQCHQCNYTCHPHTHPISPMHPIHTCLHSLTLPTPTQQVLPKQRKTSHNPKGFRFFFFFFCHFASVYFRLFCCVVHFLFIQYQFASFLRTNFTYNFILRSASTSPSLFLSLSFSITLTTKARKNVLKNTNNKKKKIIIYRYIPYVVYIVV